MKQLELFKRDKQQRKAEKMTYEEWIRQMRNSPATRIMPRVRKFIDQIEYLHAEGVSYAEMAQAIEVNPGSFIVAVGRARAEQEASDATR